MHTIAKQMLMLLLARGVGAINYIAEVSFWEGEFMQKTDKVCESYMMRVLSLTKVTASLSSYYSRQAEQIDGHYNLRAIGQRALSGCEESSSY